MSQKCKKNIIEYCNIQQKKRYSVWVYAGSDILQVYEEQKPNTEEFWFEFYTFSKLYWEMMQQECVIKINNSMFYDNNKIKLFIINYLLCDTNMLNIFIKREKDGKLIEESLNSVLSIHPRILRVLFDKVNLFPKSLKSEEEKRLEKQCSKLFGSGKSINNPHPWIVTYCNLIAFWEKFGMNYHDIMKLPNELFYSLKKIMSLDCEFKSQKIEKKSNSKGVNF